MNDEAHEDRLYAAGLPGLHDAERFFLHVAVAGVVCAGASACLFGWL
jgi:hypothetical protein